MKRNFAFTATSIASRLLVSVFLFLLLARVWGPQQFGIFSFVFSLCGLLILSVDFGFSLYLLREIGADPSRAPVLIAEGLRAKMFLAASMVVLAAIVGVVLGADKVPVALYTLLLTAALMLSFADFCIAPLRAIGRYDLETVLATGGNALQFVLPGGVAWFGGTPVAVAIAIVASRVVYLLASWRMLARTVSLVGLKQARGNVWTTLKRLWPYGVDGALTSVWSFVDVVTVRILFGAQAVGIYAAGQKCVQGFVALAPLVGNVMIPRLAAKAATRAHDTWRVAAQTGYLMAGLGFVSAVPLIAFPDRIVQLIFGPEYADLSTWLPWFGAILFVRFSGAAFGVILSAIGLQRKRVVGQLVALCVYAAAVLVVAVNGWSIEAALLALLVAMATMGSVYAMNLFLAKRGNIVDIPRL